MPTYASPHTTLQPCVAAVVITFHPDIAKLKQQTKLLAQQVDHIIMIDNGSPPSVLIELKALLASEAHTVRVKLLELGRNMGVAHAQNQGIRVARDLHANHVLLMDQDSIPAQDMVSTLLATLSDANPSPIAAVGPLIFDPRTQSNLDYLKKFRSTYRRVHITADSDSAIEVDHLIASGMLIALTTLDTLGTMDEGFFIDAVDTEWCLRVRAAGFRLMAEPRAVLCHNLGSHSHRVQIGGVHRTIAFHPPRRQYYIFRNNILLCKRPYIDNAWRLRSILTLSRRALLYLLVGPKRLAYLQEISLGIADALRGRTGPHPSTPPSSR